METILTGPKIIMKSVCYMYLDLQWSAQEFTGRVCALRGEIGKLSLPQFLIS